MKKVYLLALSALLSLGLLSACSSSSQLKKLIFPPKFSVLVLKLIFLKNNKTLLYHVK